MTPLLRILAVALALVALAPFLGPVERFLWDVRLALRIDHGWPRDLVFVPIDDVSMREHGRWPWPREKQRELLARLESLGVKTIFFDVVLPAPAPDSAEADARLAKSLDQTVLGIGRGAGGEKSPRAVLLDSLVDLPAPSPEAERLDRLLIPLDPFATGAAALGHTIVTKQDTIVRRHLPFVSIEGLPGVLPSATLLAFLRQRGYPVDQVQSDGRTLALPNGVTIPLRNGEMDLDFVRRGNRRPDVPVIQAGDVLGTKSGDLRPLLQDALAVVYIEGVYMPDRYATPLGADTPRAVVLATAMRTFDHGHAPRPVSAWGGFLLVLALALAAAPALERKPSYLIVRAGMGAAVGLVVLAILLVPAFDLFVPLAMPLTFIVLATGVTAGAAVRALDVERKRLRELLEIAKAAASGISQPVLQLSVDAPAPDEDAQTKRVAKLADGETIEPGDARLSSSSNASLPSRVSRKSAGTEALLGGKNLDEPVEVGKYTVQRSLGRGGMGAIFLALDNDLQRPVALKILEAQDPAAFERFRREALAVARISHPNVVQIYEVGLDATVPFIVMEYVAGGTLGDLLRDPDVPLPLPWQKSARLIAGIARGLGAAHVKGIVHRDIKPANLLLEKRSGDVAKVADFGIAKLSDSGEAITREGSFVGTVGYLSPEQAQGLDVDARSDVYSLGLTWFRLLTGKRAFEGTTAQVLRAAVTESIPDVRRMNPDLPLGIAELVNRMGSLEAKDRPKDGNVVAAAIDTLLS